jgi:hypothetical protein
MKPCPFCGKRSPSWIEGLFTWRRECGECGAAGPQGLNQKEAEAAWNKRPKKKAKK